MIKAINKQSRKLWHTSNLYLSKNQEEYAKLLCMYSFAEKVFFTNSGSEANDTAVKILWMLNKRTGHPQKRKIIKKTYAENFTKNQ